MITIVDCSDTLLTLTIKGLCAKTVCLLRRIMMSHISTPAMGDIEIVANTTSMSDIVLANRLWMIPLKVVDIDHHYEELVNGFHPEKDIRLEARGSGGKLHVFSRDIHCPTGYRVANEDTHLISLMEGQEIALRISIVESTGADHAKHNCVSNAWFAKEGDDVYRFKAELTGIMKGTDVLDKSVHILNKMIDESSKIDEEN